MGTNIRSMKDNTPAILEIVKNRVAQLNEYDKNRSNIKESNDLIAKQLAKDLAEINNRYEMIVTIYDTDTIVEIRNCKFTKSNNYHSMGIIRRFSSISNITENIGTYKEFLKNVETFIRYCNKLNIKHKTGIVQVHFKTRTGYWE